MKNQTVRRPEDQRPTRSAQTKRNNRQTAAHVEARRDGKPLIFGWGNHLTRTEKIQIQRLGIWSFIGLILLLVIAVFVGFWVNLNVIIPNQPIASVNDQSIPQSDYHKLVALKGELAESQIKGQHGLRAQADAVHKQSLDQQKVVDSTTKSVDTLTKQIAALPANSSQRADLQKQLTDAKSNQADATKQKQAYDGQYNDLTQQSTVLESTFIQSQIGTESAQWLQEDLVIRNWLAKQSTAIQNKINPSSSAVNQALKNFKANLPKGKSYDQFLKDSNVSDADIQALLPLTVRRENMQNYQASLITSPSRQVNARAITVSSEKDANDILKQLKNGSDFHQLASTKSLDNNTKSKGGELGWLADGQYMLDFGSNISATVDAWIMNPARTANEFSSVIKENGTYHVVQVETFDASHAVDDAKLKALKDNALKHWIELQKTNGVKLSDPDSNKLFDPSNMPAWIPSSPPGQQQGAPGAVPGVPSGS